MADKPVLTGKGDVTPFVPLEDATGLVEAVALPDTYRLGDILPTQGQSTRHRELNIL